MCPSSTINHSRISLDENTSPQPFESLKARETAKYSRDSTKLANLVWQVAAAMPISSYLRFSSSRATHRQDLDPRFASGRRLHAGHVRVPMSLKQAQRKRFKLR